MIEEKYHSPKQVAARLGLSEGVIRKWCSSGKLESVSFGAARRIPESAIVKLVVLGSRRATFRAD